MIHCTPREEALAVKAAVEVRLRQCRLEAHPDKTRLVYCRDSNRRQDHASIQFDFLGYTFRPRAAQSRRGDMFTSYLPAISRKAVTAITTAIRGWGLHRRSTAELSDLARRRNAQIRGWIPYYGRYYPSALDRVFRLLNGRLVRRVQWKYKRFRTHTGQAWVWLRRYSRTHRTLFAHWETGIVP